MRVSLFPKKNYVHDGSNFKIFHIFVVAVAVDGSRRFVFISHANIHTHAKRQQH